MALILALILGVVGVVTMWDVWVVRARRPWKRPRMKYW
jgi:hypothetical protein